MIVPAAEAGLDQLEILAAGEYRNRTIALARELVEVFSNAGMQRNLRIALSYLEEQVQGLVTDSEKLQEPLGHVRAFLKRMHEDPAATFRRL